MLAAPSWHLENVETPGDIRLKRFAEIERTVSERDGLDRSPNGAGQIGAGFQDNGDIRSASNVEPELVVLNAKVGAVGLN